MKIIRTTYADEITSPEDNEELIATCDNHVEAVVVARALTHFNSHQPSYRYLAVPDSYQLKTLLPCHSAAKI